MIKAKNLRIGDLVNANYYNIITKGTVCSITEIISARALYDKKALVTIKPVNCIAGKEWKVWGRSIEGIPLTPKILEKNGFNKIIPKKKFTKSLGDTSKFFKRCLVIELAQNRYKVSLKHEGMSDKITIRHIQYVHELQHILLALGMDADLKIPEKSDGKDAKP